MNRLIVAFTKDWDDVPTCTTHILREMAKSIPVLWVESIGMRRPNLGVPRDTGRIIRRLKALFKRAELKENKLRVLTPVLIPKAESGFSRCVNRLVMSWRIAKELKSMEKDIQPTDPHHRSRAKHTTWHGRSTQIDVLQDGPSCEKTHTTETQQLNNNQLNNCSRENERRIIEYWCFAPNAVDLLPERSSSAQIIYYCVDDWSEYHNLDKGWIACKERELVKRADVVFAASRFLERKLRDILSQEGRGGREEDLTNRISNHESLISHHDARIVYMPHGVEYEKFAKALLQKDLNSKDPTFAKGYGGRSWEDRKKDCINFSAAQKDLCSCFSSRSSCEKNSPVVGFYGNIYPWINFNLLEELVGSKPEWSFVMIGQVYCDVSMFDKYANIQFIGRREHDELPAYCSLFNVAIIPYDPDNSRMKSVNPIKTKELLSAGVPIVGVDIEELKNFGDDVLTPSSSTTRRPRLEARRSSCEKTDASSMQQPDNLTTQQLNNYSSPREELAEEWIKAMDKQIARTDRKEISERMRKDDWPVVVGKMRQIVEGL